MNDRRRALSKRNARRLAVGLGVLACCGGAGARAQTRVLGFAVDRFEPAGAGSEWFALESLSFDGHLRPSAGLVLDWARDPLVIYDQSGAKVAALLQDQTIAHVGASIALWNRLRFDVNLPVIGFQNGNSGQIGTTVYQSASGAAVGDVRLGLDVRLFGTAHSALAAAVGAQVFLPTGTSAAFADDGGLRVWPRVSLAGESGRLVWAARVGYHLRPKSDLPCGCALSPGDEVTGGVAVGVRITPDLLVGPELYGSTAARNGAFLKAPESPAEVVLGAHLAVARGWTVGAAFGPGLTDGDGSPTWRALLSLAYTKAPPPVVVPRPVVAPRPTPAPPPPPAPKPAPPPPPDRDGDKIVDSEDACPDAAGEPSEDPARNGCPLPVDRDGDGIVDGEDACPDAAGLPNADPTKNGCPIVRIEGGQIRIREQVKFKTDSARILKESDYILTAVIKILRENPEITKVRVEGHTDTQGKHAHNQKLSQRRAASVVKWLVKHGLEKQRFSSVGYGQDRPIATNQTEEGRHENRRVELHIVEGPGAETK